MPKFHYQAENEQGQTVTGEVVADDMQQAREMLVARGLSPHELKRAEGSQAGGTSRDRFSAAEAEMVVATVADVGRAELPLADGLRAAAAESTSRRVAGALRTIAGRLDAGAPLDTVLKEQAGVLPSHVRGLVAAAARTNRVGPALEELVEHHRAMRAVWWGVLASVAYPLLVLGLAMLLLLLFPFYLVPTFKSMFLDFELQLPMITQMLIRTSDMLLWISQSGRWILVGGFVLLLVLMLLAATGWGGGQVQRFLTTIPVVGAMWHWSGTASFARLLATLVDHGVPLPEALRLTADGVRSGNVRATSLWLAEGVERGGRMSDLLMTTTRLPASLVPLVRWGEKTGELAEALRAASEMFLARIRLRAQLLRMVSPALVFIVVFLLIGFSVIALFMPLVSLIQGLS